MRRLRSLKTGVYFFIILTFLLSCVLPPAALAAPTVSITRPQEGGVVSGEVIIDVSYKGEPGLPVCSVQLFVNGKVAQEWSLPKPQAQGTQSLRYNFSLNAAESHVISARAVDAQGGVGNATVTVCHTRTRDLAAHTREADIVVAAAGRPATVTADMVREGAVVIDVGVNRIEDATRKSGFRLVGDVDFEGVRQKASLITPVPGGVGPMTIAMLLHNTVASARRTMKK